ncbi:Aspartic proteinase NANA, chloroplast [Cardamine amara subsp. amara]|uniref:Aspartic proteinase NANA, chloroplast n=1 Tax=Cardamine amara subsp. amara TaxID=228776 RepID=A0ABD1ANC3_CARAN
MQRLRILSCLITILLIAAVDSTKDTAVRFQLTHRDTLLPKPHVRSIEDMVGDDQKRHNLISRKRKLKEGVKMPLGSGIDYGTAQYFTEVSVGTPAKKFTVVVDTGSELTWVNCKYRVRGKGKDENRRVFLAEESKTFKTVGCSTQTCKLDLMNLFSLSTCPTPSTPCAYDYRYADGSAALGVFAKETVTVGLTNGGTARLDDFLIGCSSSFTGKSLRGADGVLGLAHSDFSLTSKTTSLFGSKFSYCLVDHLSPKNVSNYLIIGSSSTTKTAFRRTTPIDLNLIPPFYSINVNGISLGNTLLDIPRQVWNAAAGGGTILDSGTSLTFLADAAYKPVVTGLSRYLVALKRVKLEGVPFEYCFNSTSGFNERNLPQLTFHLKGGARFDPHRRSYLIDAAPGVKCLGFVSAGTQATNVVGNIMQQNYLWEFDLKASALSFGPSTCT